MLARLPAIALWLSLALLLWFAVAVFGPKFGLIDWKVGLGTMVMGWGAILTGVALLVALIALIAVLWRGPRGQWWKAALALAIPAAIFAGLMSVRAQGESVPPIHDVATDTADPPMFSDRVIAMRGPEANPLNDYSTPLGKLEMWRERLADDPMGRQSHAAIIGESFGNLRSIAYTGDQASAAMAVKAAMEDIGLTEVVVTSDGTRVEGVAETFAFGFKDDVVARIRDGRIDLRSVSRVGVSDLGYNAERIRELSAAIEERLRTNQ
ncbi:MAG: DUF1499 domain-containing protein [Qipengyuania sp.]